MCGAREYGSTWLVYNCSTGAPGYTSHSGFDQLMKSSDTAVRMPRILFGSKSRMYAR